MPDPLLLAGRSAQIHQRVCGPLADSLFNRPPDSSLEPATKLEKAYRKADHSLQQVIQLLAA